MGVVMYECIYGFPPFHHANYAKICHNILNWKKTLHFPEEACVSDQAKDLLKSLICEPEHRLGANGGLDDFREHPFFDGIDWANLEAVTPPFVPDLQGAADCKYFEEYSPLPEERSDRDAVPHPSYLKEPAAEEFIGFTYKRYNPNEARTGRRGALNQSLFESPM